MGIALNFTDQYKSRSFHDINRFKTVNMTDISGSTGYCSEKAAKEIRSRIQNISLSEEHYLDNGNFHYLSYFFIERIEEEFDLIVFDHHNDCQEPGLIPLLSCGSWVLDSLRDIPRLGEVYMYGPSSLPEIDSKYKEHIHLFSENDMSVDFRLPDNGRPVYISIDLDILSKSEMDTVWDQGELKLCELEKCLSILFDDCEVIGIDICG